MTLKQFTEALKERASTYPLGILGYEDFCIMVDEVLDKFIKTEFTDGAGSIEPHGVVTSLALQVTSSLKNNIK